MFFVCVPSCTISSACALVISIVYFLSRLHALIDGGMKKAQSLFRCGMTTALVILKGNDISLCIWRRDFLPRQNPSLHTLRRWTLAGILVIVCL